MFVGIGVPHDTAESFRAAMESSGALGHTVMFLNRADESGIGQPDKLFIQEGRKVFKEVCPMVAQLISEHLQTLGVPSDGLKRMWLHQANLNMNQLISYLDSKREH